MSKLFKFILKEVVPVTQLHAKQSDYNSPTYLNQMTLYIETLDEDGTWEQQGKIEGNPPFKVVFEAFMKSLIRQGAKLERFRLIRK